MGKNATFFLNKKIFLPFSENYYYLINYQLFKIRKHEQFIYFSSTYPLWGNRPNGGYIFYGIYPQYLEIARVEWLRSLGISYKELEEKGIMLPVASLHIDYKKPALYDELLSITLTLKEPPTSKITFDYEIFNEQQQLLSKAHTTLVFVDKNTFKPIKCPFFILEKINF